MNLGSRLSNDWSVHCQVEPMFCAQIFLPLCGTLAMLLTHDYTKFPHMYIHVHEATSIAMVNAEMSASIMCMDLQLAGHKTYSELIFLLIH